MLNTLIPLFDENMEVKAYSIFSQKDNPFLNPLTMSTMANDGATKIPGLELIEAIGVQSLVEGCDIFVPVTNVSIFSDIPSMTGSTPHDRIVILMDQTCAPIQQYVDRVKELKAAGFKMAIRKVPVLEMGDYAPLFSLMDYVLLNNKKINIAKGRVFFEKLFPNVKLIAGNIESQEVFESLRTTGAYTLYEGEFYRVPLRGHASEISPAKLTYLDLMRIVDSGDFEINRAADIIGRDPALTVAFLQMVNRAVKLSEIKTIRHAAAMLGQKEMKRWINAAASKELYSDKPGEVTRVSLIRARFGENLAKKFEIANYEEDIFLMGIFSVLDVILDKPLNEALDMISITGPVRDALVDHKGPLEPLYHFILHYETADWPEVSRIITLKNFNMQEIEEAYLEALKWYRTNIVG